jgi:hypothetical protein
MKAPREIAIAIDRQTLAMTVDEPLNPYIRDVPSGLDAQEVLELVYEGAIKDYLAEDPDQETFPHRYDYLWYGSLCNGAIHGAECTERYGSIQPPSDEQVRRIVAQIRKQLGEEE